jgi:hypothetical protein
MGNIAPRTQPAHPHNLNPNRKDISMSSILKGLAISLLSLFVLTSPMRAQVLAGSGEVAGNIGFNNLTGVDGKKHIEYGFSGAYNLSQYLAIVGEFNDLPQGSVSSGGVTANGYYRLYGAAVRYSLLSSARAVPFIAAGGGGSSVGASASYQGLHASATYGGAYVSLGGGVSIYVDQHWGVRPEFRWDEQFYSASGSSTHQSDVRGLLSVFYQFGGKK